MRNEILQNALGAIHNIHISPIDPRMLRLERRIKQVIPRPADRLPSRALRREAMSVLHLLTGDLPKVLLHDEGAVERDMICPHLDAVQLARQDGERIVGGVADEEGEVDQFVGVGELGQEVEVFVDVRSRVSQRGEDEDPFPVFPSFGGRLDRVEVYVIDGGRVDLDGSVVVEEDGRLEMCAPVGLLVEGHLQR